MRKIFIISLILTIIHISQCFSECLLNNWPKLEFERCKKEINTISDDKLIDILLYISNEKLPINTFETKNFYFDLKDKIIRRCFEDVHFYTVIKNLIEKNMVGLKEDLQYLLPDKSYFYPMIDSSISQYRYAHSAVILKNEFKQKSLNNAHVLNVFHVAFEANNIRFGGVGSYLAGLMKAENELSGKNQMKLINSNIITPCYDVIVDKLLEKLKFVGLIPHEIDGRVYYSTIYQYYDEIIGAFQYFVKCDPNYYDGIIYDIKSPGKLFDNFSNEMWIYLSSAAAAFSASYRGENKQTNVDILQINDWHLGLITPLVDLIYNPMRESVNLPKITTISTTHELNKHQGEDGSFLYSKVGLKQPISPIINLQATFNLHADMSSTVSRAIADEMMSAETGFGLDHIFRQLHEIGRFRGITNGIDTSAFNILNRSLFEKFTVNPNYNDILLKKRLAKEFLYEQGIIGSPDKLLFLYVGRFSEEKGIDILDSFIEEVLKQNGQVVIMGQSVNEATTSYILGLKDRYNHIPEVKIYDDVQRDQIANLPQTNIKKGLLIRFASDFTLVPSIEEACGLVPIEAMSLGSIVISSYVHGLKDLITPKTSEQTFENETETPYSFTSCTFERGKNIEKTKYDLQKKIYEISNEWNQTSENSKKRFLIEILKKAHGFEWLSPGYGVHLYYQMYLDARKPYTLIQKEQREEFNEKYFSRSGYKDNYFYDDAPYKTFDGTIYESILNNQKILTYRLNEASS